MTAGPFTLYTSAKLDFFDDTQKWVTDNHRLVLLTSGYTPSLAHSTFADISFYECADGDYAPQDMTGETAALDGDEVVCSADDVSFGSSVTITARYAAIVVGIAASPQSTDELVGYFLMDTTPADIVKTAQPLSVGWSANGVFRVGTGSETIIAGESFWHGPHGLSYQMREESSLRFAWRADDFLTAPTVEGPVVNADYPLAAAAPVGCLVDASGSNQDLTWDDTGAAGDVGWDATSGKSGPLLESTAGVGAVNNWFRFLDSEVEDFNFIHVDGIFTIAMRVVFHSNPNTETHYLLDNAPRSTTSGVKIGTTDGTSGAQSGVIPFTKVRPGTVTISYNKPGPSAATLTDDGAGNLTGTNATGTIDYDTGAVSFTSTDGTEAGDIDAAWQYNKGFELATDALGGGVSFTIDAGWAAVCQVSTPPLASTAVEHDIVVTCDAATLSLFYGAQDTADDTSAFTGVAGDPTTDLHLGAKPKHPFEGATPFAFSDFTLRGLVILAQHSPTQQEREDWLDWIGGSDFSTTVPASSTVGAFIATNEIISRLPPEDAAVGNYRESSAESFATPAATSEAAPTELP